MDLTFAGSTRSRARGRSATRATSCARPAAAAITAIGAARLGLSAALASPLGDDPAGAALRARCSRPRASRWAGRAVARTAGHGGPAGRRRARDGDLRPGRAGRRRRARRRSTRARSCSRCRGSASRRRARASTRRSATPTRAPRRRGPAAGARARARAARQRARGAPADRRGRPREAARALAERTPLRGRHARRRRGDRRVEGAALVEADGVDVDAVDTTGAGDLFAAAYVWADLAGAPLEARLRWAGLYAALSVRVATGAAGAADLEELARAGERRARAHAGRESVPSRRIHEVHRSRARRWRWRSRRSPPAAERRAAAAPTPARRPTEASKTVAKPDVAKAGKVTLTVWDQEVRGGQNAQMKQLNAAFQRSTRTSRSSASRSRSPTSTRRSSSRSRAPRRPTSSRPTRAAPIMGQLVKAGLLRPVDRYARAYGWKDRYSSVAARPQQVLLRRQDVRRREPLRPLADGRDRRRLLQQGQGQAVPDRRWPSSRRRLEQAKAQGEMPIQFGNLDKFGGIHEFETVLSQIADKQAMRDFVFAKDGAKFDNPDFVKAAAQAAGLGQGRLLHAELQRRRLRPGLAAVRQGQGPLPDRRHVGDRRPRQADGRQASASC